MRFYTSGKMRGVPFYDFPRFDSLTAYLRSKGCEVVSPAEHDREVDPNVENTEAFKTGEPSLDMRYEDLLGWDLEQIARPGYIDAIALIEPGWRDSVGASHELYVARATGKRVFFATDAVTVKGVGGWRIYEEKPATIVGIAGDMQNGKDTIGRFLVEDGGWQRIAFAEALKDVLVDVDPYLLGTGASLAPAVSRMGWEWVKKSGGRELLQRLGVAVREHIDQDAWVNAAFKNLHNVPGAYYVVTDVRFPNEAKAIKDRGGQVWRVKRPSLQRADRHVSETALDDWKFDHIIVNDGSIKDLEHKVSELL